MRTQPFFMTKCRILATHYLDSGLIKAAIRRKYFVVRVNRTPKVKVKTTDR
jgi:hypothetical protein